MGLLVASCLVLILTNLGVSFRNLIGAPSKKWISAGRVVMAAVAVQALACFALVRNWQARNEEIEAARYMQRVMMVLLFGLLFAAYSIGVQKKKLSRAKPTP